MTKDQAMIHVLIKEINELKFEIGRLRDNAVIISDGATNRNVIREIWHDETLLSNIKYCYGEEWLNAPYNPPKQNLAPADKSGLEYADQPTLQSAT